MAVLFSIPAYVPDATSAETVVGYEVQSSPPTNSQAIFTGVWTDIPNSPFASNHNIVDTTSNASALYTQYRARPLRVVNIVANPTLTLVVDDVANTITVGGTNVAGTPLSVTVGCQMMVNAPTQTFTYLTNGTESLTQLATILASIIYVTNNIGEVLMTASANGVLVTIQANNITVLETSVNGATTSVTLDTPWSPSFTSQDYVYDATITRLLLPNLRFTYMNDNGISQSNGTVVTENTGAGNGLWVPDGAQVRFPLQYVSDDDPIRVLDGAYSLIHQDSDGNYKSAVPDVDYTVDLKSAVVVFAVPPAPTDYLRFDFYRSDFVNADLLSGVRSAINALSQFGLSGHKAIRENNLYSLNTVIDEELTEIICKIAIYLMRQGATESALRGTMAWRDGGVQEDPYPSRALQFLVQDLQVTEKSIQQRVNGYNRTHTSPVVRGEYEIMFDATQQTPFNPSVWRQLSALSTFGTGGIYGTPFQTWWL